MKGNRHPPEAAVHLKTWRAAATSTESCILGDQVGLKMPRPLAREQNLYKLAPPIVMFVGFINYSSYSDILKKPEFYNKLTSQLSYLGGPTA